LQTAPRSTGTCAILEDGLSVGEDFTEAADGSFQLSLDPRPVDGLPNRFQTKPGCRFLLIREGGR
jgi:hypothetical protein